MTQIRFKTTRKIVLKEIRVGTPIKTVTAGSFGINNLGGVNTSGRTTGTLLAFNQTTGNYEPVQLTGDSNHFITFDSGGNPDTLQINFTNDSISGSLIPKLDSAFDLGSSTKKWKDLFLSGSTITLGDLTIASTGGGIEVKDSDGNVLLQNLKYISVGGDSDILSYDSATSTFTFNDSDIARTDEIETFHKGVTFADSATFSSNVSVAGNLSITGDLSYDDVSADSAVFSGSVAIGNNLTADSATIPTIATTTINADQQFTDSATITNLANSTLTAKVITNTTLATDSATIGNVAVTTQLTGNQANFDSVASNTLHSTAISSQTLSADSGDIRQLSVDFINADSAFLDSATITNLSTTQITLSQMTLDSATVNNLNVDSSDIRQVSTEFINFDSAFGDSATITNIANSVLTGKTATLDSATIGNIAITNAVISSGDSATITNIANTQLTGSQATLDSATITKLNVDSSDIDHLSTEAINFDSATGDSATITSIANSTFTGKVITGTNVAFDSATITNVAIATQLTGDQASFDSVATNTLHATNLSVDSGDIRQLSVDFINADSATFDSATIGTLAVGTLNIDAIDIGDSATFTNIATTQITGSQATFDSATISGIQLASNNTITTSGDITTTGKIYFANVFSTEGDLPSASTYHGMFAHVHATGKGYFAHGGAWHQLLDKSSANDSATITNLANSVLTAKAITNTTLVGDSATITNIANSVLTAKAITGTSANIDSATIGNIAITNAVISSGDSATFTNLANTQFTGSQATIDSADIGNLKVTGITNLDSTSATVIDFDNNILDSSPYQEGRVWYDKKFKALAYYSDDSNVIHELGLEEHQKVYNNTGATILKGKPLYFSGNYTAGDVDVPTVGLADATDENKYNAQGLAAADIPNGAYGYCIIAGQLSGVDTTGLSASQNFFVGLGPGLVQNASPLYPNYPMCLGWVVSSATDGILLVNQQNHSVSSFRVRTSAHVGTNLQVDGDLTVLGSTTSVSSADLTAGTPMFRLNEGNAIGEAGTTFSGTGLDDAFYSGFFKGTANQTYYVRIDGVGTGPGGVDTFEVALGNDSTFTSPTETKTPITGNDQLIHSVDNISIKFGATTGHDSGDRWSGTAGPINVDTGFFSNRNTGSSGVGFTYVGIYYDVSDNKWKLIDEYDSNPTGAINEGDASYSKGTLVLDTVEGNVTGNLTGTVQTGNQPNITAVGTLTSLAVSNGLTADSGDIRQLSTDFINTDSAFMDSATITNLASTQLTGSQATIDSADIRILTGDSAVFSSAITTPKIINPNFTFDSNRFSVGGTGILDFISSGNFRMGINKSANIGSEGVLSTHALAVKGDAYFLDRSAGFSIELIPDTDPVVFRADNRTGAAFAGIDFKLGNGNSALDQTVMKLSTSGMELKGDLSRTSGDMTFDMPANIVLDADGGSIKLSDGGTQFGELLNSSSDFLIDAKVQDKDIKFRGNDGGSVITALTLDMSEAGKATFNDMVVAPKADIDSADIRQLTTEFIHGDSAVFDSATITNLAVGTLNIDTINIGDSATFTNIAVSTALNTNSLIVDTFTIDNATIETSGDMSLKAGGDDFNIINSSNTIAVIKTDNNDLTIQNNLNDKDFKLKGYDADGGGLITALQIDYSDAGRALFSGTVDIGGTAITRTGDLTLDVSGDIVLDAGGENIKFHDDGTEVGQIDMGSQNLTIRSSVSDKDTIFVGNDGGSEITAMTIDYSEGGKVGIGTASPAQLLEVSGNGAKSRFTRTGSAGAVMEFVSGSTSSGTITVNGSGVLGLGGGSREGDITIDASGNVVTSSLRVGNFNVDSADVITISKNALSTGSPDALTYDSAAGQFALNANHVMALIQTVDSNGSGLNADTLEGQAGSHYRINVYNASGTLLN